MPAVLIALTIAGGVAPGAVTGSNITGNPAFDALPGATLISTHGCVTLPQLSAQAAGPSARICRTARRRPSKADIEAQIVNGGSGMPPFKDAFSAG